MPALEELSRCSRGSRSSRLSALPCLFCATHTLGPELLDVLESLEVLEGLDILEVLESLEVSCLRFSVWQGFPPPGVGVFLFVLRPFMFPSRGHRKNLTMGGGEVYAIHNYRKAFCRRLLCIVVENKGTEQ